MASAKPAVTATVDRLLGDAAGNTIALNRDIAPAWVDRPNVRGTADILWTCLVTLTACVYTALHLNIPPSRQSQWRRFGAKVEWVLVALLGPELVLHTALSQFRDARHLCRALNGVPDRPCHASDSLNKEKFDLTYGYWVVMGGFVADVSAIHDTISHVSVNVQGVEILAEHGHFLEMPKHQIEDRSKANILAKSLVCIQVTWMLVQCITRKAAGYPLTLLEIHTMVHVACALCIYIFWWKKPLDILEPVSIDATAFENILALMLIGSVPIQASRKIQPFNTTEAHFLRMYPTEDDPTNELKALKDLADASAGTNVGEAHNEHPNEGNEFRDEVIPSVSPRVIHHFTLERGSPDLLSNQPNAIISLKTGQSLPCGLGPSEIKNAIGFEMALSPKDIRRWELAAEAMRKLDMLQAPADLHNEEGSTHITEYKGLSLDSPNLSSKSQWELLGVSVWKNPLAMVSAVTGDVSLHLSGVILPLIYGGVHLSAWSYSFPSTQECIMWRMSGIGIMTVTPLMALMVFMGWFFTQFIVFAGFSLFPISAFYAFCRAFLVVEAFLSLRHAPLGVYAAVPWVQNIPHI